MFDFARIPFGLALAGAITTGACASVRQMRLLEEQHAGATYEALALGCDLTRHAVARRFSDLAGAVAWARGVASVAPRDRACEISIDAVDASDREPVYLVRRDFKGVWTVAPATER